MTLALLYFAAFSAYVWHFVTRRGLAGRVATGCLMLAVLVHTFVLGMYTMELGMPPMTGRTGAVSTFVWMLADRSHGNHGILMRPAEAQEPSRPLKPAAVDGARALGYLKKICDIGPRPAGSEANTRQRVMVAELWKVNGLTVTEQPFTAIDPVSRESKNLVNLIGSWKPERTKRVVIGAHYDTRPFPDEEPDLNKRRGRFIGANDGASGVALLMELSHHLPKMETEWGVDFVLFDGEELVYGRNGDYFLGSRHFARKYLADKKTRKWT